MLPAHRVLTVQGLGPRGLGRSLGAEAYFRPCRFQSHYLGFVQNRESLLRDYLTDKKCSTKLGFVAYVPDSDDHCPGLAVLIDDVWMSFYSFCYPYRGGSQHSSHHNSARRETAMDLEKKARPPNGYEGFLLQ